MKLRMLTAVAVLASAAVHLRLWFEGYRDIGVIGPQFLVNAVAGVLIAVLGAVAVLVVQFRRSGAKAQHRPAVGGVHFH